MVRVGDTAYPGVSPVAMQQGRHVARRSAAGSGTVPLPRQGQRRPRSAGLLAVVDLRGLQVSGFAAWLFWLALHIYYLVGFGNRLLVMSRWAGAYFTRARGARLITSSGGAANPVARTTFRARGVETPPSP